MKILLVEDEKITRITLTDRLMEAGHEVMSYSRGDDALHRLDASVDVVITDLRMPGMDGIDLLKRVKSLSPSTEVIVMTAYSTVKNAVEALRHGAYDYLSKPFTHDELLVILERMHGYHEVLEENRRLKRAIRDKEERIIVGESASMKALMETIDAIADGDYTVLIQGESGTGKELVAEAVHRRSSRSAQAFVRVNCAALSETVLESELYGHEKGAFTGALRQHKGRFERSSGGTIFLDDIDDFPMKLQVKLLRTLQEREIERVGGDRPIPVDLRIVSATKVNLMDKVNRGEFREDLFYRLNIVPLTVPPLRERVSDLSALVDHFLLKHRGKRSVRTLSEEALVALGTYSWPGNVRELENIILRMVALSRKEVLGIEDIPANVLAPAVPGQPSPSPVQRGEDLDLELHLEETEKRLLLWALEAEEGNQTRAATRLKLPRNTFRSKCERYGL